MPNLFLADPLGSTPAADSLRAICLRSLGLWGGVFGLLDHKSIALAAKALPAYQFQPKKVFSIYWNCDEENEYNNLAF